MWVLVSVVVMLVDANVRADREEDELEMRLVPVL